MTPKEHYIEAEKLLVGAGGFPHGSAELVTALAEAQVHATLATAVIA